MLFVALDTDGVGLVSVVDPRRPVALGAHNGFFVGGETRDLHVTGVAASGDDLAISDAVADITVLVDADRQTLPVVRSLGVGFDDFADGGDVSMRVTVFKPGSSPPPVYLDRLRASPAYALIERRNAVVSGTRASTIDLSLSLSAIGSSGASGGAVELYGAAGNPLTLIDAVSVYPAATLSDARLVNGAIVVGVRGVVEHNYREIGNDAIVVVNLPFPVVSSTTPIGNATGVGLDVTPTVTFAAPVTDVTASLTASNGSSPGSPSRPPFPSSAIAWCSHPRRRCRRRPSTKPA